MNSFTVQDNIFGPPVKVESPEQFVPIYLAYTSPFSYRFVPNTPAIFFPNRSEYLALVDHHERDKNLTKEEVKKRLVKMLNYSYPDQYNLPIPIPFFKYLQVTGNGTWDSIIQSFYNSRRNLVPHVDNVAYSLPGLLCLHSNKLSTATLTSRLYFDPITTATCINIFRVIKPLMVIVVKAKHIPALRAGLHLEVNVEIPVSDFMLCTLDNPGIADARYISNVLNGGAKGFMNTQGINQVYKSAEELKSFVIGEYKEPSITDILDNAIGILKEEEKISEDND